ncbi:MAG: ATP-binding protein [Burkholderiaceae bacterium]
MPFWAAAIPAGAALLAGWCAFAAYRGWHRLNRQLARLNADAARLSLGERRFRSAGLEHTALEPAAVALNRLASLVEAAESLLDERDRQLSTLRSLGEQFYWEQNVDGRFTRVDFDAPVPQDRRLTLLGRNAFDGAQALDAAALERARAAIERRRPFHRLVLWRSTPDGSRLRTIESGTPLHDANGRFVGYAGIGRVLDDDLIALTDGSTATAGNPPPEQLTGIAADVASLQTAVDTSSEPTLLVDAEAQTVLWGNCAAQQLFERRAAELAGRALGPLFSTGGGSSLPPWLTDALRARRPLRRTLSVANRFGEQIDVLLRLEPCGAGSARALLVVDPRDAELAAMRARSQAGEALQRQIELQAQQVDRQSRELESFGYTISHDLRAPLRAISGFAKILNDDHAESLGTVGRQYLERIVSAGARMDRMIDAMLSLARLSTLPMATIPLDLSRIAGEVVANLRMQNPERHVDVRIGESLSTTGDATLMRTVLENLIGNAWKYTARSEQACIVFDAMRDSRGRTAFFVQDNGAGFDMSHADRLFGLFQRLHPQSDYPGTGLGLAAVQKIIQRHEGTVWAEARPEGGSMFSFTVWDR